MTPAPGLPRHGTVLLDGTGGWLAWDTTTTGLPGGTTTLARILAATLTQPGTGPGHPQAPAR